MRFQSLYLTISKYALLLLLLFLTNLSFSQESNKKGDVTRDGVIDGRDALRVLRDIKGLELLSDEESILADVAPYPGLNGAWAGDGLITQEDVNRLLQAAVGLVSEGELTGDFSESQPIIQEMEPLSGPVGTQVILSGKNFSELASDLIVEFGDISAPILETSGTEILIEVPEGASTGRIRVRTPGGSAVSPYDFIVGVLIEGHLDLGQGIDPQTYSVVNWMDVTEIDESVGNFSLLVPDKKVSLLGAVPVDGEALFLSVHTPVQEQSDTEPTVIDALSTAKSLVFLHPFFMTDDVAATDWLMKQMDQVQEVSALADIIATRYPQGSAGLDDTAVENAWTTAVNALVENLPDRYSYDVNSDNPSGKTLHPLSSTLTHQIQPQSLYDADKFVSVRPVERVFLEAEYDEYSDGISVGFEGNYFCPLDWMAVLWEVNPDDFALGFNTPYNEIRSKGYPRLNDYKDSQYIAANQWTVNFDLMLAASNFLLDRAKPSATLNLQYDTDNEGVYMLRMFSGCFVDHDGWDTLAIESMGEDGKEMRRLAAVNNISLSIIDLWFLVSGTEYIGKGGEKNLRNELIKSAAQYGLFTLEAEMAGKSISDMYLKDIVHMISRVMVDISKGILQTYINHVATLKIDQLKKIEKRGKLKKVEGLLLKTLEKATSTLNLFGRISSFGRFAERMAGLTGRVINPLEFELSKGPTPLETYWIIIGDPFGPRINSFSPQEARAGEAITIEGERFALNGEDNEVYFDNVKAEQVKAISATKLEVVVPDNLEEYKPVHLLVQTPRSSLAYRENSTSRSTFRLMPDPKIASIEPSFGYAATSDNTEGPYQDFDGSRISIKGQYLSLVSDTSYVFFGDEAARILFKYDDELVVKVPKIDPGIVKVVIRNPEPVDPTNPTQWRETTAFDFTVLGPPIVTEINLTPIEGEIVTVTGEDLTDAIGFLGSEQIDPLSQSGDRYVFRFFNLEGSMEPVQFTLYTPGGKYSTMLTPKQGEVPNEMDELLDGALIFISEDRDISLDTACMIASGEQQQIKDDYNIKETQTFRLRRRHQLDEDGNPVYKGDEPVYDYYYYDTPDSIEQEKLEPLEYTSQYEQKFIYRVVINPFENRTYGPTYYQTLPLDGDYVDQDGVTHIMPFETGDYISLKTEGLTYNYDGKYFTYSGEKYLDKIIIDTDSVEVTDLHIGQQDILEANPDTIITVNHQFIVEDESEFTFGTLNLQEPVVINQRSNVTIHSGVFNKPLSILYSYFNTISIDFVREPSEIEDVLTIEGGSNNHVTFSNFDLCRNSVVIENSRDNFIRADSSNCTENGVVLKNSQRNDIHGEYSNCSGNGIFIESGMNNTIDGDVNNSGTGIRLLDTTRNDATLMYIDSCAIGVLAENCESNLIHTFVSNIERYGAILNNCILNKITGIYEGCEIGIYLQNECSSNHISADIINNQNGIVLEGSENHDNEIASSRIGFYYDWDEGEWLLRGNQQNGIWIKDGSHNNSIIDTTVVGNDEHGIVLDGEGTDAIRIEQCTIGYNLEIQSSDETNTSGNGLDGITIQNGSSHNRIEDCYFGWCKGDAISISGPGSQLNRIFDCKFATYRDRNDDPSTPNDGWGISIEDGGSGTDIQQCYFGVNSLGAITVTNLTGEPTFPLPNVYIEDISINWDDDADATRADRFEVLNNTGIAIHNAQHIQVEDCDIVRHNGGIAITGESSSNIAFYDLSINDITGNGLSIDGGNEYIFDLFEISDCGGVGVGLSNIDSIEMKDGTSQNTGADGITIQSCADVNLSNVQLGPDNMMNGIQISDSVNTVLFECRAINNRENGFLVNQGSLNTVIELPRSNENSGNGILLQDCEGVFIYGDPDDSQYGFEEGFASFINQKHQILITDAQHIEIGKEGEYGYLGSSFEYPTILIQGDQTNHITIANSKINGTGNDDIDVAALKVEGGQNITIGSDKIGKANDFTFNEGTGIHAEGTDIGITIIGNLLGEHPGEETDDHQGGNENGIILGGHIEHALITDNTINSNRADGIILKDSVQKTIIKHNTITHNEFNGIHIQDDATQNQITGNSITANNESGIFWPDSPEAPIITQIDPLGGTLSGKVEAPGGSIVEAFADSDDEGKIMIDSSRVLGDTFSIQGIVPIAMNYHATVTHPDGSTSEFGPLELEDEDDSTSSYSYVYTTELNNNKDIYLKHPKNDLPIQMTNNAAADHSPRLSPTGSQVLFVSDRAGNSDIWMMNNNGSNQEPMIQDPLDDYDPDWSQDEKSIVFTSERDGNPEIYLQSLEGGLGNGEVEEIWSTEAEPDYAYDFGDPGMMLGHHFSDVSGTLDKIAFYIMSAPAEFEWRILDWDGSKPGDTILASGMTEPTGTGWYTIDIDDIEVSTDFVAVMVLDQHNQPHPGVSITGSMKDFWLTSEGEWIKAYNDLLAKAIMMAPQAAPAVRLTNDSAIDRYPMFSPDQSKIAFTSNRAGNMDIWVMDSDGSNPIRLTDGAGEYSKPSWSKDGEKIVFVSTQDDKDSIYIIDADGQNFTQILHNDNSNTDPVWDTKGKGILFASDKRGDREIYTLQLTGSKTVQLSLSAGQSSQPDTGPAAQVDPIENSEDSSSKKSPTENVVMNSLATGDGTTLSIESGQGVSGDQSNLTIDLQQTQNIANLAFDVEYNQFVIDLLGIPELSLAAQGVYAFNPVEYSYNQGFIRFNWIKAEGFSGDGELWQLALTILENSKDGNYPLSIQNLYAYDIELNELPISSIDGMLTVMGDNTAIEKWMLY
jgi:parallel beta-helix repeat protein